MSESEQPFDYSKVNVITATFYNNWTPEKLVYNSWKKGDPVTPELTSEVRSMLAEEMIKISAELGANVVVVDGSKNPAFREALRKPNVLVFEEAERGMSAGRQQGFQIAELLRGKINAWVEPEKVSIPRDCLSILAGEILNNNADLGIPFRDADSFATYPAYQAEEEQESNRLFNNILKAEGLIPPNHPGFDAWIGPRVWHQDINRVFLKKYESADPDAKLVRPDQYCNAIFFPILASLIKGYRVKSIPVPYRHPEIQTAIELNDPASIEKRAWQQSSILETVKHYVTLERGEPSKLRKIS